VTVRAAHDASADLPLQSQETGAGSYKIGNIIDLLVDVVEFQDYDVRFAAVHACIGPKVFVNERAVAPPIPTL
jgi:hypothetical protein